MRSHSSTISIASFRNIPVTLIIFLNLMNHALSAIDATRVRFDGHRLYRIYPKTPEHYGILSEMYNVEGYSFWSEVGTVVDRADVMVSPEKLAEFRKVVTEERMDVEELMDDVQRFIDTENPLGNSRAVFGWSAYHNLDGINGWMETLASDYPDLITPLDGGESYEGRIIRGLKLSFREGNPGVFLEGGIHAREWISPAVITYILNELITSTVQSVREVAESHDWYIFPVYNPDGYVYTHETNRMWRKTRQPYTLGCVGADPNRNWDFHWKGEYDFLSDRHQEIGASSYPCGETFAGGVPFSEKETKTMSEFITSVKDHIFAYIAFHSYSQVILLPYGHTNARVDNYADLMQIGNVSASALAKRHGTSYKVGNLVDILYAASGSSMDWVRGTLNVPVTFTYELRDRGRFGFLLPADQIIPTGEETLDSMIALLQETKLLGYGSSLSD